MLHGPKTNLKYYTKLHDEVIDKKESPHQTSQGKVFHRPNFAQEQSKPDLPVRNDDLFGVKKANDVGPQQYSPRIPEKNKLSAYLHLPVEVPRPENNTNVKNRMEKYLGNIFESSKPTEREHNRSVPPPVTESTFELNKTFQTDSRYMAFKSKIARDPFNTNKQLIENPSPGAYNPVIPKTKILKGRTNAKFGSSVPRKTQIVRNALEQPFKDPTNVEGPAPGTYSRDLKHEQQKDIILQTVPAHSE